MRRLFWPYLAILLLLEVSTAVENLKVGEIREPVADLLATVLAAMGMLLYRTRREYPRTRSAWKWIVPVVALGTASGSLTYSLLGLRTPEYRWLLLSDVVATVLLLTPALWLNIRYAAGYSDRRRRLRGITQMPASAAVARPARKFDWVLVVAILGTAGSFAGLVLGFRSYRVAAATPELALHVYKAIGDEEYWYETVSLSAEPVRGHDDLYQVEVPLKVINHSDYDAVDIVVWIRSETDGAYLTSENAAYRVRQVATQEWLVLSPSSLSPQSAVKCEGVRLHAPSKTREVRIGWRIFASRMLPRSGELRLKLLRPKNA